MRVLIDADVLLDIALDRLLFADESSAAVEQCQQAPQSALLAWHTVSNVYYVLRAARTDSKARTFLLEMLRFAVVARAETDAVIRAFSLPLSDFEDALQVAAAQAANADVILTRNVRDYRGSPVTIQTPHDFLQRHQNQ